MAEAESIERSILVRNDLLGQLAPAELDEFLEFAAVQDFGTDEVIFSKGDPGASFYAILLGRVGISTVSEDGREILLNILEAGQVFGEVALLDGKRRTASAVAMQPTRLLTARRKDFMPFLERHPKLCIRLMTVLCSRLRWTSDIIEDTMFLDIPHRLAKRLMTLADGYGTDTAQGLKLGIRLSQEELGHMLGATRESINKGLRALQHRGAIFYDRGHLVISDPEALRRIASRQG